MRTDVLSTTTPDLRNKAIGTALRLLHQGDIVALPTETVYGLAADALKSDAVIKIFEAKMRPRFDPLIVHLPDSSWLERIARIDPDTRPLTETLAARLWPGPLTLVLPRRKIVPDIVTAGLNTVALRMSAHPLFAELTHRFGSPLAAPSANRFGRVSPTAAEHVLHELEGRIPLILDAGPTQHGIESTIVALRNGRIEILRRGPITFEQLRAFGDVVLGQASQQPEAPGQLSSHYAPSTPLVLVDDPMSINVPLGKRYGILAWRPYVGSKVFSEIRQLSATEDVREAASNLFRYLRELDQANLDLIVAEKLPDEGIGAAVNDRLIRAATQGLPNVRVPSRPEQRP